MAPSDPSAPPAHTPVARVFWSPEGMLATWFGSGLLPGAPGTWGALAALPFAWAIDSLAGTAGLLAAVAALFGIGLWATGACLARGIGSDPGAIVIDEVAAQWLTLAVVSPDPVSYAIGFFFFRLFDIVKPWPVSWADRRLKGAFGVMADDVVAAAYAAPATWLTVAGIGALGGG